MAAPEEEAIDSSAATGGCHRCDSYQGAALTMPQSLEIGEHSLLAYDYLDYLPGAG